MVRAGGIAADSNSPDEHTLSVVERKTPPENINAAYFSAHHRIIWGCHSSLRVASISDPSIHRIARLKAEQAAARLYGAEKIRRRQRELPRQAERVCSIRLLRRNDPASGPLRTTVAAGIGNRADDAVAIDDGAPHVEVEPAVRLGSCRGVSRVQLCLGGQQAAGCMPIARRLPGHHRHRARSRNSRIHSPIRQARAPWRPSEPVP